MVMEAREPFMVMGERAIYGNGERAIYGNGRESHLW